MTREFMLVVNESAIEAFNEVFNPNIFKFVEVSPALIANEDRFCLLTTPKPPVEKPADQPIENAIPETADCAQA